MFTIVITQTSDGLSARVEDADVAAQNTVGLFNTREEALAFMNAMPELAAEAKKFVERRSGFAALKKASRF